MEAWLFPAWAFGFVTLCFAQMLGNAMGNRKRSRWWILIEATLWPFIAAWAIGLILGGLIMRPER